MSKDGVSEPEWRLIGERVASAAAEAGLDIVQTFNVAHYNQEVPAAERLVELARPGSEGSLGILLGNTRRLWPAFVDAYGQDPELSSAEHPLDRYVIERVTALLATATAARTHIVFAHVTTPTAFPIQRLAQRIGMAALAPSHLAIHPQHGPWFALRAVAVVDVAGPDLASPPTAQPCLGCSAPCLPALERALRVSGEPPSPSAVAQHADAWIAVRDACPVGRASRYGEAQLAYHYGFAGSRPIPRH